MKALSFGLWFGLLAALSPCAAQTLSVPEPLARIGLLEARQEHYREAVLYRKVSAAAPPVSDALANIDG